MAGGGSLRGRNRERVRGAYRRVFMWAGDREVVRVCRKGQPKQSVCENAKQLKISLHGNNVPFHSFKN